MALSVADFTAGEHAATYSSSHASKKSISNTPRQFSLPRNHAMSVSAQRHTTIDRDTAGHKRNAAATAMQQHLPLQHNRNKAAAATATQQQHSSSRRRTDERPWQTGTLYLHKPASTSLASDRQRARASGLHSGPRT
jgi:hypothetical protein